MLRNMRSKWGSDSLSSVKNKNFIENGMKYCLGAHIDVIITLINTKKGMGR